MRVLRTIVSLLFLSASLLAADLKVKVVDPHSDAVSGAQVSVFPGGTATPTAVLMSSGEGTASFSGLRDGRYQLQVLAPGFAAQTVEVAMPQPSLFVVNLTVDRKSVV